MKKMSIKEIIKINIYLFIFVICLLKIQCETIKYFKSFYLLSQEILLITDIGFLKYQPTDNSFIVKLQYNVIFSESELDYISFIQAPLDEGGYVFCRIKQYIFIFDENLNFDKSFELNEIGNSYCVMNTYTTSQGSLSLIISYITNSVENLRILMYQININDENNLVVPINNITQGVMSYETNSLQRALPKKISCEMISKSNYSNKLLSCFAIEYNSFSIVASVFDPENNLEFLFFSQNSKTIEINSHLNTVISSNNKKVLICYIDNCYYLKCLIYNSETNKFKGLVNTKMICDRNSFYMGVNYINEKEEYMLFCLYIITMNLLKLDTNYKPKEIKENNVACYSLIGITDDNNNIYYSSYIIYNKNDQKYYLLKTGRVENDDTFILMDLSENCLEVEVEEVDLVSDPIESTLLLPTTIINQPTTILEETTELVSSFPPTQILSTIINPPTTILEKIFTSIPLTTIIEKESEAKSPPTIILEKSFSSIPLTTIIETQSEASLFPTIILPPSTIISSIVETENINSIIFYSDGDIMRGKINKTKEELEDSIDKLMKNIEIGKKYEITGNDYNVTIRPINYFLNYK